MRVIEAKNVYRPTIRDWLLGNFGSATWDQVRQFIWSFVSPEENFMGALLRDVGRWEAEGLSPDKAMVGTDTLRDYLLVASATYCERMDNLTWIGSRVPPEDTTGTVVWSWMGPDFYLSPFIEDKITGGFLTVHGPPRMGKTGLGCLYGELWLERFPGTEVLTNIPLMKAVDRVRMAVDMPSLAFGVAQALIAQRRWLWVWDEPTLSKYGRGDATTNAARNVDRFARIIPKLGGSLVFIEHRVEGTPTIISDFAQSKIVCTHPGFILVDLPGKHMSIRSVPKPREIQYRTGEAGYFELEDGFDWTGFFRALRFHPEIMLMEDAPPSEQGQRILAFLEAEKHKPPKRGPGRPRKDESEPKSPEE